MKFKLSRFSVLGILVYLMACGSEESTQPSTTVNAGVEVECNTEPEEVWVSAEEAPLALRELAPGVVLEAVGVKALRGCELVSDTPIAAFNWWTVVEPEANAEYTAVVGQLLMELGAKIIFTGEDPRTLRQPSGTTPEGTAWIHPKLDLPLYPSAEAFAGMLSSEAWLEVGKYKMQETNAEDYDFVFMKCFYGCEAVQAAETFIGFSGAPTLAHLFNGSQSALNSALDPLAAELEAKAFGRLHFAGYAWALPMMRFDGLEGDQPNENGFWHDATILIELEPGIEPGDIILLEAYQNLMMNTQNDAIVLF